MGSHYMCKMIYKYSTYSNGISLHLNYCVMLHILSAEKFTRDFETMCGNMCEACGSVCGVVVCVRFHLRVRFTKNSHILSSSNFKGNVKHIDFQRASR